METNAELRSKFVLMKLINPALSNNSIIKAGEVMTGQTISEYGIFGIYLHDLDKDKVIMNSNNGHLVRTKPAESKKGGVAVGSAAISSIQLVD
jgi:hypothetical protein